MYLLNFFEGVFLIWIFGTGILLGALENQCQLVSFFCLNQTALLETGVKNHFAVGKARESECKRKNNIYKALPMLFG